MLPRAAIAAAALVGVRHAARNAGDSVGPGIDTMICVLGWFLVYFFVPALPIRYGLGFDAAGYSAAAALMITVAAAFRGAREVLGTLPARKTWAVQMITAAGGGLAAAYLGYVVSGGYPELRLLIAAAAFCTIAITVCVLVDRAPVYWR
jgi:hypothetical protein